MHLIASWAVRLDLQTVHSHRDNVRVKSVLQQNVDDHPAGIRAPTYSTIHIFSTKYSYWNVPESLRVHIQVAQRTISWLATLHACSVYLYIQFNGLSSRTPWVSRREKGQPFWILMKQQMMGGSGISWAICKSFVPRSRPGTQLDLNCREGKPILGGRGKQKFKCNTKINQSYNNINIDSTSKSKSLLSFYIFCNS